MVQLSRVRYTRAQETTSMSEQHQFTLTDHTVQGNYVFDWEGVIFLAKDPDRTTHCIKEAITANKRGLNTINRTVTVVFISSFKILNSLYFIISIDIFQYALYNHI